MDIIYIKDKKNLYELIMTVAVPVLLGLLDYLLTKNYVDAVKLWSEGSPPVAEIIFALWLVLAVAMGIASYRIKLIAPQSRAHISYALQLFLFFLWQIIFFRFLEFRISLVVIILYLIFICATFFEFEKIDKRAGFLMLPAVLWALALSFITFLVQ